MRKRGRDDRKRGPPRQFDDRQAQQQANRMENDGMDQGGDFNIWYGPRKKRRGKDKALSRCDPAVDSGVTRGSEAGALEFCVFFSRGSCARGYSCHKLHFTPMQEDDAREDNMHDCFGRERSGVENDDRDGVGCFLKENRTLWVGRVPVFDEASARERLRQNFGAWGRISSVRLVKNKSCAFVQYTYRANAEFAKEAMSNQALLASEEIASSREAAAGQGRVGKPPGPGRPPSSSAGCGGGGGVGSAGGEDGPVLHVRWAAEDPNPRAVLRAREGHAQTLLAAQVATGALSSDVTGPLQGADRALLRKMEMSMNNPSQIDLELQNTQRQCLAVQGHAAAHGHYPSTDHQYPNTDHQYPSTDHQYPNTDHQYPRTDSQYPNADNQYPNTDDQYPHTDNQYPSTDNRFPRADRQYPNNDYRYPNSSAGSRCPHAHGIVGGTAEMSNNAAGDTSPADRAGAPLNWRAGGAVDGTALRFAPGGGGGVPGTGSLVDGDRGVQGDDDKSTAKHPVRGSHASGELPSAAVGAP
ncbi:unnamed protein product, partial [Pylaiella littoralis]